MNSTKSIVALCADKDKVEKKRIVFSESSGLIISVDSNVVAVKSDDYIFQDNCLLFAGMGDIHIHAREDVSLKNIYKEDFSTATAAALNGGIVHVGDMPNNPIPPIDDASYAAKVNLSAQSKIPFLMYAGVGPNTHPLSYSVPYKAFMGPSIGELYFKNNFELEETIKRYKNTSMSFHCEDPIILENHKSAPDHFKRRPLEAEVLATNFALFLIEKYHLKGKLCHYSSGEGLEAILSAKKRGIDVSAEVTPQHLFFTEEMIKSRPENDELLFQMNPPIRHENDRLRLIEALKRGELDFLATDHAPHSHEEKIKGMSGMAGLDTYALFVTWLINNQQIDPRIIAKVCSYNPGQFFNNFLPDLNRKFSHYHKWGKGLGVIEPGYSASFTVLNLTRPKTLEVNNLKSKSKWSPFLGYTFPGSVEIVFCRGQKSQ